MTAEGVSSASSLFAAGKQTGPVAAAIACRGGQIGVDGAIETRGCEQACDGVLVLCCDCIFKVSQHSNLQRVSVHGSSLFSPYNHSVNFDQSCDYMIATQMLVLDRPRLCPTSMKTRKSMISTLPLAILGKKMMRSLPSFQQGAFDRQILSPAEKVEAPKAIFDDADLSKVTGYAIGTNHEIESARINGGPQEHGATVAYYHKDCALIQGHLFSKKSYEHIGPKRYPLFATTPSLHIKRGSLVSTWTSIRYFGDWLPDSLMTMMASPADCALVSTQLKPWDHEAAYAGVLSRVVERTENANFQELVMIDDRGQNAYKRERYETFRSRLQQVHGYRENRGVFLMRGESGAKRSLANEMALAELLDGLGIDCFEPHKLPAQEVIKRCMGAAVVMGVEGSHLAHGFVAMRAGAPMLVLQPPHRFGNIFKARCDCVGSPYAFLVGDLQANTQAFTIDKARLLRMLERLG